MEPQNQERVTAAMTTVQELKELSDLEKLTLPRFQRQVVWKPADKRELIDSLVKRFPIGAILIQKNIRGFLVRIIINEEKME